MFASGHIVAHLAKSVRDFYANMGLGYLYRVRIFERASSGLAAGMYNLFWINKSTAATESDISSEMFDLIEHFAKTRGSDAPAVHEYEYELGRHRIPQNRTEVLHPLFVLDKAPANICIGHMTDMHVCVRANVFERNLSKASIPAGQYNNYNTRFSELYVRATTSCDTLMFTGDIIDYGCGHRGDDAPLGELDSYLLDRNWILFFSLLASGGAYRKPTYTVLGNHDWNLYPYGPASSIFSIGKDMNITDEHVKIIHGRDADALVYPLNRTDTVKKIPIISEISGIRAIPKNPLRMNVDSVRWYLLLINPFLDYSAPYPGGYRCLMLDWGEDVELFRRSPGEGIVIPPGLPNATECLTDGQKHLVEWFVGQQDKAKVLGLHASIVGPRPFMPADTLMRGVLDPCPFCGGEADLNCSCFRFGIPQTVGHAVYPILAVNDPPEEETPTPKTYMPLHGTIKRHRDWLINMLRKGGDGTDPVSLVLSGHAHRNSVFVIAKTDNYAVGRGRQVIHAHGDIIDVGLFSVAGKREGGNQVPPGTAIRIGDPKVFPLRTAIIRPLYVNTTSAGPAGDSRPVSTRSSKIPPGYSEVVLESDGTITSVEHKYSSLKLAHWECWIRRMSKANYVKLHKGGIIGGYDRREDATAESGADQPWFLGDREYETYADYECWVRKSSAAKAVKLYDGGIIGIYESEDDAKAEKGQDEPWQKWIN